MTVKRGYLRTQTGRDLMRRLRPLMVILVIAAAAAAFSAPAMHAQVRATRVAAMSAGDVRAWDTAVDRMRGSGELRSRAAVDDPAMPGRRNERLDQYYRGVRVYGGDASRQTAQGSTVSIFGTVYSGLSLDVAPALSAADAKAIVERIGGTPLGADRTPELLVLADDTDGYRLVYRAKIFTRGDGLELFLDAGDGRVVRQLSAAERQASTLGRGRGVLGDNKKISVMTLSGGFVASDLLRPPALRTYDLRTNLDRVIAFLNGVVGFGAPDLASSATTEWSDPVAVDAQADAGFVYDYYFKRFGRHGLDNNNIRILNVIHPVLRADVFRATGDVFGTFFVNAFYAGDGVMVYGEGLPTTVTLFGRHWNYLAGALDVSAHELTHGVTEFTSGLIYRGESGALNEAFSDMMGTAVEFYYQPAGTGPLKADYLIGEDVVTPGGLRSLSNPGTFGDPDHYSLRYLGLDDNGGVHTNANIATHAYYLAIEGGTNRTSGLSVAGVGAANREQIENVFYRAFTQLMPAGATFAVARAATVQAARDLYGTDSAAERAVVQAWTAVGVN